MHILDLDLNEVASVLGNARAVCGISPSTRELSEIERHPQMLV